MADTTSEDAETPVSLPRTPRGVLQQYLASRDPNLKRHVELRREASSLPAKAPYQAIHVHHADPEPPPPCQIPSISSVMILKNRVSAKGPLSAGLTDT